MFVDAVSYGLCADAAQNTSKHLMYIVHNIKQPLSYYTSQDITLCVCRPGYITEFVRNILHMREQTMIIMLFFLAHNKLPGTRLTLLLPSCAMHPWANV